MRSSKAQALFKCSNKLRLHTSLQAQACSTVRPNERCFLLNAAPAAIAGVDHGRVQSTPGRTCMQFQMTGISRPHVLRMRTEFAVMHAPGNQNGARAMSDASAVTTSSLGLNARCAGLLSCLSASAIHNIMCAQKDSFVPLQNSYLMQPCARHSTHPRCRPL